MGGGRENLETRPPIRSRRELVGPEAGVAERRDQDFNPPSLRGWPAQRHCSRKSLPVAMDQGVGG